MTVAESEKPTLAYSSAATFNTTLDHLGAVGIPNLLDRNALPSSFSGSSKYEMLGTMRFFDLIDKDGKPDRDRLSKLVNADTRTEALREMLEVYYRGLFALPLSSAGPTELQRWFAENATPSTVGKAKAFFLALAKQTAVPMHTMVAKGARVATGSVRRKRKRRPNGGSVDSTTPSEIRNEEQANATSPAGRTARTVALRGASGSVTVSVTADLWELDGEDRDFVLFLMDVVKAWERGTSGGIWAKAVDIA